MAGCFGCAPVIAGMRNASGRDIFGREAFKDAGATDTRKFLKKLSVMVIQLGEKLAMYIRLGRKCTQGVAIKSTTDSTDTGGGGSLFVRSGQLLRDFLRTWALHGRKVFPSTESTTTAITSPQIAGGRHPKSRQETEKLGEAGVESMIKKAGGGWAYEVFE